MALPASLSDSNSFVIKRTFLELIDDSFNAGEPVCVSPLRLRAHSDPALYEQDQVPAAEASASGDVEFELAGLSDFDAEDAKASTCSARQVSDSTLSELRAPNTDTASQTADSMASGHDEGGSGVGTGFASKVDIASLLRENARLALENQLLKENARLISENADLQAQATNDVSVDAFVMSPGWVEAAAAAEPATAAAQAQAPAPAPSAATPGGAKPAMPPGVWLVPWGAGDPYQENYYMSAHFRPQMYPLRDDHLKGCHVGSQPGRRRQGKQLSKDPEAQGVNPNREPPSEGDSRTTVMLRNLPNNYNREMVLAMLDVEGFEGLYDFIYLPIDFKTQACLGYAFVNLASPSEVPRFWETFNGYSRWAFPSKKVCSVTWSGPHQGRNDHVDRYRNSPVMHPSVPEEYKPIVFEAGHRIPFPAPTKTPKAPRMRNYSACVEA